MITIENLRTLALSFPETTEEPHFEKTSFRARKKIFVSYDKKKNHAIVKLSEVDQDVFSIADRNTIYPVPNKWGKQGWTVIDMNQINANVLEDAVTTAYCEVARQKLAELIRPKNK